MTVKIKGFKLPVRSAKLIWEPGTDYDGAEVIAKLNIPMGLLVTIQEHLLEPLTAVKGFELFGTAVLLEWNLLDEAGQPISPSGEGMLLVDPDFAGSLLAHWLEAVQRPSAPLVQPSVNGSMSEEPLTAKAGGE